MDSRIDRQIRMFRGDAGDALESVKTTPEIAISLRQQAQDEAIDTSMDASLMEANDVAVGFVQQQHVTEA